MTSTPADASEAELARLAALDAQAYELQRTDAARLLRINATVLDDLVRARRNISPIDLPDRAARLALLPVDDYQRQRRAVARWFGITVRTLDETVAPLRKASANAVARADGRPDAVADLVREFNAKFSVVNESGKAVIYQPVHDKELNRERFDYITFADFRNLYLNRRVCTGVDEHGNDVTEPAAEVWLRHPDRRQFIGGVIFDPASRNDDPVVLNLWRGFAYQPAPGDWSLLRNHIRDVICGGDRESDSYLMGWLATMFQHPERQGEVAIVMRGGEGTGKGTLAKVVLKLFGQHGLQIANAKHLTGNFNAHLADCVALFADEAFFAGDRAHIGVIKSLITEQFITVEGKYQNARALRNRLHVLMASNEQWVIPASLDSRRFFVRDVLDSHANDHAYFAAIWKQMDAGGYAAMLHDLLTMDLTGFNVRAVPRTAALDTQRKLSLPVPEAWWMDCLQRGYVFRSRLGLEATFSVWMAETTTELLFDSYSEFARSRHERHPMSRETFGRFMHRMGGQPRRLSNAIIGEHLADQPTAFGTIRKADVVRAARPQGYDLGSLDCARSGFEKATRLAVDWTSGMPPEPSDALALGHQMEV